MNHLILTEKAFIPPNWKQGLPEATIIEIDSGEPGISSKSIPEDIVWVVSTIPNWHATVSHYGKHRPVVVISKVTNLAEMQKAIEHGARGYIEALAHPTQYRQAAETVSKGALWIAQPMLSRMISILSSQLKTEPRQVGWADKLSSRERQVAELAANGMSNQQVADKLNITVRTVKEHMGSIFSKLGVRDRLHLVLLIRTGTTDHIYERRQ